MELSVELIRKCSYNEILINELKESLLHEQISNKKLENENQKLSRLLQLAKLNKKDLEADLKFAQEDKCDLSMKEQNTRKQIQSLENKISVLEKRLELVSNDKTFIYQEGFRSTLSDLIKENEQLKRQLVQKTKNNKSYKEQIQKLISKNHRLNKKLESMKVKHNADDMIDEKLSK